MNKTRDEILSRIRSLTTISNLPDAQLEHPSANLPPATGTVDAFIMEVERLSGRVIQVKSAQDAVQAVIELVQKTNWDSALCWEWDQIGCDGLEQALAGTSIEVFHDGSPAQLAAIPVGITGAEGALADTGTLILRNGLGRNPLASLLPPVHVALVNAASIHPDMPAYFNSLPDSASHVASTSNLVFISGPSRTADIEQTLTLGVHGPREVVVILYE